MEHDTDEPTAPEESPTPSINLDAIERDLADVDQALSRLESGRYWTDEFTGEPIDPDYLAQNPTVRRNRS